MPSVSTCKVLINGFTVPFSSLPRSLAISLYISNPSIVYRIFYGSAFPSALIHYTKIIGILSFIHASRKTMLYLVYKDILTTFHYNFFSYSQGKSIREMSKKDLFLSTKSIISVLNSSLNLSDGKR